MMRYAGGADAVEQDDDRVAVRYRIEAEFAGRRFEAIALDLGLGDPLPEQAEVLAAGDLLRFAGLTAVVVPALPVAAPIAEKVHAYTRVRRRSRKHPRQGSGRPRAAARRRRGARRWVAAFLDPVPSGTAAADRGWDPARGERARHGAFDE